MKRVNYLAAMLLTAFLRFRRGRFTWVAAIIFVALFVAIFFLSELGPAVWSIVRGYYVLAIDLREFKGVGRRFADVFTNVDFEDLINKYGR